MKIWSNIWILKLMISNHLIQILSFIIVRKMNHIDELLWYKFIIVMKIEYYDSRFLMQWKFIILRKIYHYHENLSLWWKFIIMINIDHFYKIYHIEEKNHIYESHCCDKIHHCNEKSALWWKFINITKTNHCDENSI